MRKVFITKKCTQRKTLQTLKTHVFELPDKKNIGKLFSNCKFLFLDQANFSSDPSQILMLQYPISRASMLPTPSFSNFPLV